MIFEEFFKQEKQGEEDEEEFGCSKSKWNASFKLGHTHSIITNDSSQFNALKTSFVYAL